VGLRFKRRLQANAQLPKGTLALIAILEKLVKDWRFIQSLLGGFAAVDFYRLSGCLSISQGVAWVGSFSVITAYRLFNYGYLFAER
jgi:hypothetical protein